MFKLSAWKAFLVISLSGLCIRSEPQTTTEPPAQVLSDKHEAEARLAQQLDQIVATAPESKREQLQKELEGLKSMFRRYLTESGSPIVWDKIQKLPYDKIKDYNQLDTPTTEAVNMIIDKLVVVKLNGGLGTSMGCEGPKSVIPVRGALTFLDMTVKQIESLNQRYNANVTLLLMNSFNTDEETKEIISKYNHIDIQTFKQSFYPRIVKDKFTLLATNANIKDNLDGWYPPGHGDFFQSFKLSGLLDKFIAQGKEYIFLSNIDNLGATVDANILNYIMERRSKENERLEFVSELTEKTKADIKGGTLIQYEDKMRLLEVAQIPKDHVTDFKSYRNFKYFHTNNLWIDLKAIKRVVEDGSLNMELIVNPKKVKGVTVIQLETAVGAAIKSFNSATALLVPRSRFLPVKKTSDLMMVLSNLYIESDGSLVMNPRRSFPSTPIVSLGDPHFTKVKDFQARFTDIPDMIDADHVTISGDVTFGKDVTLKGTVIIMANPGDKIDIPASAVLEDKIVSGNFRISNY